MHASAFHYLPLAPLFFMVLVFLFVVTLSLFVMGVLGYAYEKMGVSRQHVFALLMLSLLGSYVNIPIAELPPERMSDEVEVTYMGIHYLVPQFHDSHRTVLAVNVGGALIPTGLSLFLMIKQRLYVLGIVGVAIVAAIVHWLAKPVPGVGIAIPTFLPPIAAAVTAVVLSRRMAAPLAYIAGTLGTLIGGDLLNLGLLPGLGAPVASIGGAGTFDGVFLTGILAVLLA
jgi:uncharacterized membrane protein